MNRNLELIQISGIRKFYNKVLQVPEALSLTLGEPDFKVPDEIKRAMIDSINGDRMRYTSNIGIVELRNEISKYLHTMDVKYSKDEICITVGGSEGLFSVFQALLNPGDKVVIPTPAYPAYESIVKLLSGEIINCSVNDEFALNIEELKTIIEENKPKVIVLSYPSNPTGSILGRHQRDELCELIKQNDILVVTDEMYGSLVFDDYYTISQDENIKDKVILVGGFSKMFSMTGLRIGYVCAVDKYMKEILKVHQYNVSCAPSIAQWGAYEGLKSCMDHVENAKVELIKRRDYVFDRLSNIGFEVIKPRGAFYIFPSIKKFDSSSERFCERMLYEAKVAAVPGSAFGSGGEGYMRISYSYSMEELVEGLDRIERWITEV